MVDPFFRSLALSKLAFHFHGHSDELHKLSLESARNITDQVKRTRAFERLMFKGQRTYVLVLN